MNLENPFEKSFQSLKRTRIKLLFLCAIVLAFLMCGMLGTLSAGHYGGCAFMSLLFVIMGVETSRLWKCTVP